MSRYQSILVGTGILALVLIGAIFFFGIKRTDERFTGEVTLWSFEQEAQWEQLIETFESQYPELTVMYERKNPRTYENDLLNALAGGRGPDMFVVHHTWLAKHSDKMTPAPRELMTVPQFREAFVDAAANDLTRFDEFVAAVPLYVDTLALYYNTDIFNTSGVTAPPKTWEEFNEVVRRTVIRSEEDTILQAGATIGTQNNVPHADDILETLMLQNGAQMVDVEKGRVLFNESRRSSDDTAFNPGENALTYYTNFADPARDVYTWSRRQGKALSTFTDGDAAMYIGYAQDIGAIRDSGIPFNVAPLPQVTDRQTNPNYIDTVLARYWAGAVSPESQKREAAWAFWTFATSRNAQFHFLNGLELPTSRRDLVDAQVQQNPQMGVFARQSLIARSWIQPDHEEVAAIFKRMIEAVVLGRASAVEAVREGAQQVGALFQQQQQ